jgi:hypothetical protein
MVRGLVARAGTVWRKGEGCRKFSPRFVRMHACVSFSLFSCLQTLSNKDGVATVRRPERGCRAAGEADGMDGW